MCVKWSQAMSKFKIPPHNPKGNGYIRSLMDSFSKAKYQATLDKLEEYEGLNVWLEHNGKVVDGVLDITDNFVIIWKKGEINEPRSWWSIRKNNKNVCRIVGFGLYNEM